MNPLCWLGWHQFEKPRTGCVGFYCCIRGCGSRQLWSMGEYDHTLDRSMGDVRVYR